MKLTQLAAKPQLIKIELHDDDIIAEYGEAIEFWIWDRQPMKKFIRLVNMSEENYSEMIDIVEKLVLDDTGMPFLREDNILPTRIMSRVVQAVIEKLGK